MTGPLLVLLVEDEPLNTKLMRAVLEAAGFVVIHAGTGRDGITLARERRPDVILLDIGLPDIDGVRTLRHLRERPETCTTPVAAVTAQAMKGDRERLLAAGFDDYMAKPIDVQALPGDVRRLAARGAAEAE